MNIFTYTVFSYALTALISLGVAGIVALAGKWMKGKGGEDEDA